MFAHTESWEVKPITLLGKSLPGALRSRSAVAGAEPQGCRDGHPHTALVAQPARGQAPGSWVASPGWDRELLVLTSAPRAGLYGQCRHEPSQRTSLVILPSNLPTLFFSPKICKIRQGTG